jgi:hypothetical protein
MGSRPIDGGPLRIRSVRAGLWAIRRHHLEGMTLALGSEGILTDATEGAVGRFDVLDHEWAINFPPAGPRWVRWLKFTRRPPSHRGAGQ